jgi:predicted nucleotidyltransferase
MRLDTKIVQFFKSEFSQKVPDAALYLFGSRVDDNAKGGDIDLMIISQTRISRGILRSIRTKFYQQFGWQKIDMVNFTQDENPTFRQLIQSSAILL